MKSKMLHDVELKRVLSWEEWHQLWNEVMSFDQRMGLLHGIFEPVLELDNVFSTFGDDLDYEKRILFLLELCEDYERRRKRTPTFVPHLRQEEMRVEALFRKVQTVLAGAVFSALGTSRTELHRYFSIRVVEALAGFFRLELDAWRPANLYTYSRLTRSHRVEKAWWDFAVGLVTFSLQLKPGQLCGDPEVDARHSALLQHRQDLFHVLVAARNSDVFLRHVRNLRLEEVAQLLMLATRGKTIKLEVVAAADEDSPERELAQVLLAIEAIRGVHRLPGM